MNEVKYTEKMFAFLDILGFESIVKESRSDPELVCRIARMLMRSKDLAQSLLKPPTDGSFNFKVLQVEPDQYNHRAFSDMSVISGPYISHDDMIFLSWLVMLYQYLMWKGERTFVRGAIVYGDIYEDEDVVFGPALIEAYHLESCETKTLWPRVLVDKSLLSKNTPEERKRDLLEFLREDADKLVYLDYLRELFHLFVVAENKRVTNEKAQDHGAPISIFEDHKKAILAQAYKTRKKEKQDESKSVLIKYLELSRYHNSIIDRLRRVIKNDLVNIDSLIREFYKDQFQAKRLPGSYKAKYSAEEHPEQSDMLDILGVVINQIIEKHPPDVFEMRDILIVGRGADLTRVINTFSREAPKELSSLDKALQGSKIDINSLGLNV